MRVGTFAVTLLMLCGMAGAAFGTTYLGGPYTITTPTDQNGSEFIIGTTAATTNVLTVDGVDPNTGALYNLGTGGITVTTTNAGRYGKLVVTGAYAVVGSTTSDGAAPANADRRQMRVTRGAGSTGVVEISNGGTIYAGQTTLGQAAGTTLVTVSGGLFDIYQPNATSTSNALTVNNGALYTQTGGTLNVFGQTANHGALIQGNSTMDIQGGTVVIERCLVVGSGGTVGTFRVTGSSADITANAVTLGGVDVSLLSFVLNDASGVSCIKSYGVASTGGTIDLSGYTPLAAMTLDLLRDGDGDIGTVGDLGVVLGAGVTQYIAGVQAGWTLHTNAQGDTLQATYTLVPEPATMALLGMGLLGVMYRRRR